MFNTIIGPVSLILAPFSDDQALLSFLLELSIFREVSAAEFLT
jgi:hypothetical protein